MTAHENHPKLLPNEPIPVSLEYALEQQVEIVNRLRSRRIAMRISQDTLAQSLGLTEPTILNRENHRGLNDLLKVILWANALGLRVSLEVNGESNDSCLWGLEPGVGI